MGVTVHCFSLDAARWSRHHPGEPTVSRLLDAGIITDTLEVVPTHAGWIAALDTFMGDNKKWYRNLSTDTVYTVARQHITDPAERAALDALMGMLFWDPPSPAAADTQPLPLDQEGCRLYPPALLERVHRLSQYNQWVLEQAVLSAAAEPDRPEIDHPHLWEPEWFLHWVEVWLTLFERARTAGAGRSLLMWVWV